MRVESKHVHAVRDSSVAKPAAGDLWSELYTQDDMGMVQLCGLSSPHSSYGLSPKGNTGENS